MGILVDQEVQDQVAGNLQGLEEVVQGKVYPCLPLAGLPLVELPSVGLPLVDRPSACLQGVTVVETSEGT